ncbi:hypothetical protein MP228_005921 [Amoeboaphelidium protococcarum]|nr:hypothetical protein MP228_005921 [Amoeboaphelidium protococcarum]
MIDSVAKRQIATAAFILLLAVLTSHIVGHVKLVMLHSNDLNYIRDFSLLLLWSMISSFCLGFLYIAQIPKLVLKSKAQWLSAWIVTLLLVTALWHPRSPVGVRRSVNGFLRVFRSRFSDDWTNAGGGYASSDDQFIEGSLTVQVVPHSSLSVTNIDSIGCIRRSNNSKVNDPVFAQLQICGVAPFQFSYSTEDDVPSLLGRSREHIININQVKFGNCAEFRWQINGTGKYAINWVKDAKGSGVVQNKELQIEYCPEAQFAVSEIKVCQGQSPKIPLNVEGPQNVQCNVTVYSKQRREFLHFNNLSTEKADIDMSFEESGTYQMFITRVDCGQHRTVYTEGIDASRVDVVVQLSNFAQLECPKQQCYLSQPDDPTKLRNTVQGTVQLQDKVESAFVEYKFTALNSGKVHLKQIKVSGTKHSIQLDKFGSYQLISYKDDRCSGRVSSNVCLLQPYIEPQLDVKQSLIAEAQCSGNYGFKLQFGVSDGGKYPLLVKYTAIEANGQSKTVQTKIVSPDQDVIVQPKQSGKFSIRITEFKDSMYPDWISVQDQEFSHEFKAASSLSVLHHQQYFCPNADMEYSKVVLPLKLTGSSPWTVSYSIQQDGYVLLKSTEIKVAQSDYELRLDDKINQSGSYKVEFDQLTDGNGCKVQLQESAQFRLFASNPQVSFASPDMKVDIIKNEGRSVPLKVFANKYPVQVEVLYQQSLESIPMKYGEFQFHRDIKEPSLFVDKAGIYTIKSVQDALCKGSIDGGNILHVSYTAKPSVKISDNLSQKKRFALCQNDKLSVKLSLGGQSPFEVGYTIVEQNSQSSLIINSVQCLEDNCAIEVDTGSLQSNGDFSLTVQTISDSNYKNVTVSGSTLMFKVNKRPEARFKNINTIDCCVNSALPAASIPELKLVGQMPFNVTYAIDDDSVKSAVVDDDTMLFKNIPLFNDAGIHHLQVIDVADGNQCSFNQSVDQSGNQAGQQIVFNAITQPEFEGVSSQDYYCVGQEVQFNLRGHKDLQINFELMHSNGSSTDGNILLNHKDSHVPYTKSSDIESLQYKFQRKKDLVQVAAKLSNDGQLKLKSICQGVQSADKSSFSPICCKQVDAQYVYHSIPRVKITTSGKQIIREGSHTEMNLQFQGHPPFGFTYVRLSDDHSGKVLEKKAVSDITSAVYSMPLDKSGTYRVVSVQDKYCKYPSK